MLLGLLLLAATGAFTGLLIAGNLSGGPHYAASVLGESIATMSMLGAFPAGLALALIFCLGLAMSAVGLGGHRARRAELRSARRSAAPAAAERGPQPGRTADEAAASGGERAHRQRRHLFGH